MTSPSVLSRREAGLKYFKGHSRDAEYTVSFFVMLCERESRPVCNGPGRDFWLCPSGTLRSRPLSDMPVEALHKPSFDPVFLVTVVFFDPVLPCVPMRIGNPIGLLPRYLFLDRAHQLPTISASFFCRVSF